LIKPAQRPHRLEQTFDPLRLHELNPERYPYLLESVVHGTPHSRYDILFAFPGETLSSTSADFLPQLSRAWETQRHAVPESDLPFQGGWFLYLGYETAAEIEPTLTLSSDFSALPNAFATRIPAALVRDHQQECCYLVCEPGQESLLVQIEADIAALDAVNETPTQVQVSAITEEEPRRFIDGVGRIRDYIREGDVFQVNLSRAWSVDLAQGDAAGLYRSLRLNNPAPFAALVNFRGRAIISSSPERLVKVTESRVSTRPIAGTRPRGSDRDSDKAYSDTLLAHPKERAEHVMLIDLERNDLGRVCIPGSIEVDELMVLESYAHVHHIVSNVSGQLRPDVTPVDVIRAVFPGGTITGCPKVRCMEIIQELEQNARGPYTGSVGYLSHCGRMDLNILIRTMLLEDNRLTIRTGAGIVADSIAEQELEETRAKARGLLRALGIKDNVSA
jgi:anthranilate synthase component 1